MRDEQETLKQSNMTPTVWVTEPEVPQIRPTDHLCEATRLTYLAYLQHPRRRTHAVRIGSHDVSIADMQEQEGT